MQGKTLVCLSSLMVSLLCLMACMGASAAQSKGWTLTWSDEFNGRAGSAPDPARWTYDLGGGGWGNNELEYYTNSRNNSYLDGKGNLVITVKKEPMQNYNYTSARLKTLGLFAQKYGKFEARIKVPYGQGIWPAFWMMGDNVKTAGWPKCGELDIMENIGKEPSIVHGTAHGPGYSGAGGIGGAYTLPKGEAFKDKFHVFGIEWDAEQVRWYVDGKLFQTLKKADLKADQTWVYDHPHFFLLNVAVGGYWPGMPDATTTFPQSMLIDYIRVYKAK